MIALANRPLPKKTAMALSGLQSRNDAIPNYHDRVASAKAEFSRVNKETNAIFKVVRSALYDLCGETKRCIYCEDSYGDEVEHVAPKDLYPEHVFRWENYVYACGACNTRHKGSHWHILNAATGQVVDVIRGRNDPVIPPIAGINLFINPRTTDPMQYLQLDIFGRTFYFVPRNGLSPVEHKMAVATESLLGLNSREVLVYGRRNAYDSFISQFNAYDRAKVAGSSSRATELSQSIRTANHRTVWKEMRRQASQSPELDALFGRNPEAVAW